MRTYKVGGRGHMTCGRKETPEGTRRKRTWTKQRPNKRGRGRPSFGRRFHCDTHGNTRSQVSTSRRRPIPLSFVRAARLCRLQPRDADPHAPRCGPTDVHRGVCAVCLFRWFVSRKDASTPSWLAALPSKCQQVLILLFSPLTGAASSVHTFVQRTRQVTPSSALYSK